MRKTIYTLLLPLFTLLLFTTCKNPEIDYNTFSITSENIVAEGNKVLVSGEYDFLGEVMSMKINIGLEEQLSDAESYSLNLDNHGFSVTVDNLNPNTSYHYCYIVEFDQNHKLLTDVNTFKTLSISDKPIVRTLEVSTVDETTVFVKCIVDDSVGMSITERGICWNDTGNPAYNDNHVAHPLNGLGEYTCVINNLDYNKNYFVCAYAINANGVGYGQVLGFHVEAPASLPSVTTAEVTNIAETTATGGGTVDDEGSTPVTERGICWSTGHNPDLDDFHAQDNLNGLGSYTINMTNLTQGETYFVRAYAINEQGPAFGEEVSFIAQNVYPIVTMEDVMEELTGIAVCKYSVDDEGSSPVIESGICYSTGHDPDITNHHTVVDYSGLGNYSAEMADLTQGETYFFRAYAMNSDGYIGYSIEMALEMKEIFTVTVSANPTIGGTVSGGGKYFKGDPCTVTAVANTNNGYRLQYWAKDNELIPQDSYSFIVTSNVTFEAHFVDRPQPPVGTIDGWFTVDGNRNKIWFSQGNLQYKASTQKWQFAPQQYDIIGDENSHIDQYYNGWIDLFGWATSGYHNPSDPGNVHYQPWTNSQDFQGYGPSNTSGELTGNLANYDWGVYNAISNGGNQSGLWRTLTKNEWNYVFNERQASTVNGIPDARFAKAYVNDVFGVILFPDDYTHPTGVGQPSGINGEPNWNGYNYNTAEFELMQAAGAVFLPVTGKRYGTAVNELNIGHYWSVTYDNMTTAFELRFDRNSLSVTTRNRCDGLSVRLVCPVQ